MNSQKKDMNPVNGFGFLTIGFWMWLLPALAPDWFPAPLFGGTNGQALWLEGMGVVQMLLGGGVVLRHFILPSMSRWAAVRKAAETAPSFALSKLRGGL
jgi:hypothetical protein